MFVGTSAMYICFGISDFKLDIIAPFIVYVMTITHCETFFCIEKCTLLNFCEVKTNMLKIPRMVVLWMELLVSTF